MKYVSVKCTKDGKAAKQKSLMHKLANYTYMFAVRYCNVGHAPTSPTLKPSNVMTETDTGFIISNAAQDARTGVMYARYVHNGHGGPIPYAGNPWMTRGLASALKMLGTKQKVNVEQN